MFSAELPSWVPACGSGALSLPFAYGSEAQILSNLFESFLFCYLLNCYFIIRKETAIIFRCVSPRTSYCWTDFFNCNCYSLLCAYRHYLPHQVHSRKNIKCCCKNCISCKKCKEESENNHRRSHMKTIFNFFKNNWLCLKKPSWIRCSWVMVCGHVGGGGNRLELQEEFLH